MRVIGVLDVLGAQAVHARAGDREHYLPVQRVAGSAFEAGSATALARVYKDRFGLTELYVADLDAILAGGAEPSPLVTEIATLGGRLWLDAGVSSAVRARRALDCGATHVVVGLETLRSFQALEDICVEIGGAVVAFSLDLRHGEPMLPSSGVAREAPELLAARAASAGAGAVIVIDVARVGTGAGLDIALIGRVREATPGLTLLAGGGIGGPDDLARLFDAGCDGGLVASALHDGRIAPADVMGARDYSPRSRRVT